MGIWITLRQNNEKSFFRDNLLGMISNDKELDGNRLILASGYFSEYEKYPYSIFEDDLDDAIRDNDEIKEINVIGSKGSETSFNLFCNKIESLGRSFIKIRHPQSNWHAKIAMKLKPETEGMRGTIPICAIVGSSNLTRPAYGITPRPENVNTEVKFNYECDVLIFVNDNFTIKPADDPPRRIFPRIADQGSGSIFFPEINEKYSYSESKQLDALFHMIKNSSEESREKL
jgi:hypothetical protein